MALGNTVNKLPFKRKSPNYLSMFILIMHILFCPTNQKCVLQKGIKVWTFEVYILTGEFSSWLADWIIEDDFCQTLWVVPEFFVKEKGFGLFLQPSVLPKVSKIAVTCPKSLKRTRCVNFDLYKVAQWLQTLNCSK